MNSRVEGRPEFESAPWRGKGGWKLLVALVYMPLGPLAGSFGGGIWAYFMATWPALLTGIAVAWFAPNITAGLPAGCAVFVAAFLVMDQTGLCVTGACAMPDFVSLTDLLGCALFAHALLWALTILAQRRA